MLIEAITVIGLIAGSFAATNVDNLALLVTWLLSGRGDPRKILYGYLIGMFALLSLAFAFGLGANFVPEQYIGYLGCLPIGLGLKGLYDLMRSGGVAPQHADAGNGRAVALSIASTQVVNGVDTVLVFGPLLADSETGVDVAVVSGFLVMVLVWFRLARFLQHHASRIEMVERYGHWISPIVLIVVGFYILDNTATDLVVGH